MKSILLIGDEHRCHIVKQYFDAVGYQTQLSDGDDEEDFKNFDVIFDLNFDDVSENFPIYAGLKDKLIFLGSAKQTLAESNYIYPSKIRSKIFGINSFSYYLASSYWEVSVFRGNEVEDLKAFMKSCKKAFLLVDDIVGMYRPKVDFVAMNQKIKAIEQGHIANYMEYPFLVTELKQIDEIGVTDIFEGLMAMYEDTQDPIYLPTPLLKKKYLRNHAFLKL